MNEHLHSFLLSAALILTPASGFALFETYLMPTATAVVSAQSGLGDLSAYRKIVRDTQDIAKGGHIAKAEQRITDLEALWDKNAAALRKADPMAWGLIDGTADTAFAALRARSPDPVAINEALAALLKSLDNPTVSLVTGTVFQVAGIDVTDANGHPIPCEEMAGKLRAALVGYPASAEVSALQAKALERCNADDDAHSDAFAAQALSLIKG